MALERDPRWGFSAAVLLLALTLGCPSSVTKPNHTKVSFDMAGDGEKLVFASRSGGNWDLYLWNSRTNRIERLTESPHDETAPWFSPDSRSLVFESSRQGERSSHIVLLDLEARRQFLITTNTAVSDAYPAFSPDGRQIVFARATTLRRYGMGGMTWDHWDICTVSVDGTGLRQITAGRFYTIERPQFTTDGKEILFAAIERRSAGMPIPKVFVVATNATAWREMESGLAPTTGTTRSSDPYLFPDGKRWVWISDRARPFYYDLYVAGLNETTAMSLGATSVSRYNRNPVVVRDGRHVLFLAAEEFDEESRPIYSLWSINTSSLAAMRLAGRELFDHPLRWTGDAKWQSPP